MLRFNILVPSPLVAIFLLLGVVYYIAGIGGITVFAVAGMLCYFNR